MSRCQKFYAAKEVIDWNANILNSLGSAFHATGNTTLADKLWATSKALTAASNSMSEAFMEGIEDQTNFSTEATKNMVDALVAGISIGKKAKS